MSTLASLPFFLCTLPAGALADRVNRQKLISIVNVGLAAAAGSLAVLGWVHLLNPFLILVSVFCFGLGFAFNAPAWTSILPQVVSDAELSSAATLSGLQFNVSGIIGPVAAVAGVGWTMSASELWVAAQRAIPNRARGRMNAIIIMISQGAMAVGGVTWGSTAAIAGTGHTLLGAAALFFTSLLLGRRLSINVTGNLEEAVSGFSPGSVEEAAPIGFTKELLPA